MKKYVIQRMNVAVDVGEKILESKSPYLKFEAGEYYFVNGVNDAEMYDSFEDAESGIYLLFRWVEQFPQAKRGFYLTIVPIYIMD